MVFRDAVNIRIGWIIAILAVGFAIFIGITDNGADDEREELRAENDALARDLERTQRESYILGICSRESHTVKSWRIKQLEKKLKAYKEIYGENVYSFGQIPE